MRWPGFIIALVLFAIALWFVRPMEVLGWVAGERPKPSDVESVELKLPLLSGRGVRAPIALRVWYPTHSKTKFPLIIYGPAWGGTRSDNAVLLQEIARSGYIVLAYDDVVHDPVELTSAADTIVRKMRLEVGNDAERERTFRNFDLRLGMQAGKVIDILDGLSQISHLLPPVDTAQVALIGASFGGAVAAEVALLDARKRVQAVINLDGWMGGLAKARPVDAPFLIFNSTRGDIPISEVNSADPYRRFAAAMGLQSLAIQKRQLESRADSRVVTVTGAAHTDFMDELYSGRRWLQWRPWRMRMIRPARMRAIVDAAVIAFLDEHLKGIPGADLPVVLAPYHEVAIQGGTAK